MRIRMHACAFTTYFKFPLFSVHWWFSEREDAFLISLHFNMEQLAEINFIATLEGQEEERAMAKIISTLFAMLQSYCTRSSMLPYKFPIFKHSNASFHSHSHFFKQGFTRFNYTSLEVLAIIEHVQKHLN